MAHHGRGSCDAKGILAAQVAAVERCAPTAETRSAAVRGRRGAGQRRRGLRQPRAVGSQFLINGEPTDSRLAATRGNFGSACARRARLRIPPRRSTGSRRSTSCSMRWCSSARSSSLSIGSRADLLQRRTDRGGRGAERDFAARQRRGMFRTSAPRGVAGPHGTATSAGRDRGGAPGTSRPVNTVGSRSRRGVPVLHRYPALSAWGSAPPFSARVVPGELIRPKSPRPGQLGRAIGHCIPLAAACLRDAAAAAAS